MTKLICLLGSPRRGGNTDLLAQAACQAFEEAGGEVETLVLSKLDLRPCTGCDWCKQQHDRPCVIQDDMQRIYDRMLAADAILWGTPVYSWAPSVELKIVLDRQFALGDYQSTTWAAALAAPQRKSFVKAIVPSCCFEWKSDQRSSSGVICFSCRRSS